MKRLRLTPEPKTPRPTLLHTVEGYTALSLCKSSLDEQGIRTIVGDGITWAQSAE